MTREHIPSNSPLVLAKDRGRLAGPGLSPHTRHSVCHHPLLAGVVVADLCGDLSNQEDIFGGPWQLLGSELGIVMRLQC